MNLRRNVQLSLGLAIGCLATLEGCLTPFDYQWAEDGGTGGEAGIVLSDGGPDASLKDAAPDAHSFADSGQTDATLDGGQGLDASADTDASEDGGPGLDGSTDSGSLDGTPCTNECTAGLTQCLGPDAGSSAAVQKCEAQSSGCTAWITTTTCATGATCLGGACACPSGQTDCAGACTNTNADPNNCGACGSTGAAYVCTQGFACLGGQCRPPSCAGGAAADTTCGQGASTDCCETLEVDGGSFYRGYDGVTAGDTSMANPASVSSFRLDAFEVSVGRFRHFVDAVDNGWLPTAGAGKHTHLNGGSGLTNVGTAPASSETGWNALWSGNLATTKAAWDTNLACQTLPTWTSAASANGGEYKPINCVTWYEAYAFCIWDGGFLPSEAEWNYAAAGGSDQRVYPWSSPPSSTTISTSYATYACSFAGTTCQAVDIFGVGSFPSGIGKWGQFDLAGNVWEWTLDFEAPYVSPCTDCVQLASAYGKSARGGSYAAAAGDLTASARVHDGDPPIQRANDTGFRCARTP